MPKDVATAGVLVHSLLSTDETLVDQRVLFGLLDEAYLILGHDRVGIKGWQTKNGLNATKVTCFGLF